jgi:hypothetical protein
MRSVLAVLVSLAWVGGAALAQAPAPALSGQAAVGVAQVPTGTAAPPNAVKRQRNGGRARRVAVADRPQERPRGTSTVEEALTSCLALWEPATHMTKSQWARACRRVAERLRNTG